MTHSSWRQSARPGQPGTRQRLWLPDSSPVPAIRRQPICWLPGGAEDKFCASLIMLKHPSQVRGRSCSPHQGLPFLSYPAEGRAAGQSAGKPLRREGRAGEGGWRGA